MLCGPMATAQLESRLRADARENRDAVLAAARKVFGEQGLGAPLDMIARRAGVGRATLYRRFPTRDDLVHAIFDDNLAELSRVAAEASDPSEAYLDTLLATVQMLVEDRGFVDLFNHSAAAEDVKADVASRFLAVIEEPLRRAQEAGRVRDDLRPDDTLLLVDMVGGALQPTGPGRPPDRAERAIGLLLDALDPAR
jgi:AcrR family transcriptional regulator